MVVKFSQEVQHRFYPLGLWISVWNEIYHYCTAAWRGLKGRSSACMYEKNGADTICVSVFKPWRRWFSQWFCLLSDAILVVYNCVGGHLSTWYLLSHLVFCVGWWHEWFHTHKGVISADDYRKWFKCMDLTGRITHKMFWPVHILTQCLDIVAHIGFRLFFLKPIYYIQYSKGFDLILPIKVLLTGALLLSFRSRSGNRNLLKMAFLSLVLH